MDSQKKNHYMSLLEDSLLEHFPSEFNPTSPHEISNNSTDDENEVDNLAVFDSRLSILDSAAFLFEEDDGACAKENEVLKGILESARQLHADVLALKSAVNGQSRRLNERKCEVFQPERKIDRKLKHNNSSDSGLNEKRKETRKSDKFSNFEIRNVNLSGQEKDNNFMFEVSSPILSTPPSYPKKGGGGIVLLEEDCYVKQEIFPHSSNSSLLSGEFFTKSSNSEGRSGERKFYTKNNEIIENKKLINDHRGAFLPFIDTKPPRPNKFEIKKDKLFSKTSNILKPTPILYDQKFSKNLSPTKSKSKPKKSSKKSNDDGSGNSSGSSPIVVDIELPKLVKIKRYKSATTKHPRLSKVDNYRMKREEHDVGIDNYFKSQGRSHTLTNLLDEKVVKVKKERDSKKDSKKPKKLMKSKSINYSKSSKRPELKPVRRVPVEDVYGGVQKSSTVAHSKYNHFENSGNRGLSLMSSSSDEISHRPPLVIVSNRKNQHKELDQF